VTAGRTILKFDGGPLAPAPDRVAVEAPLEIRVAHGPRPSRQVFPLTVTMRTPGHDADLVAGFLFAEGLLASPDQLEGVVPCGTAGDVVRAELAPAVAIDEGRFRRAVVTTSACGVCGKLTLAALESQSRFPLVPGSPRFTPEQVVSWPDRVRAVQPAFDETGGLHAAALLTPAGEVLTVREDVGRHNAVDKVIGASLDALPLSDRILVVTGRAGFELVQKAVVAGIPVLAAVGAPSSAAVELAEAAGLTLLGFVRDGRFNVYTHADRVVT
jgi:FdhD protein